MNKKEWLIFISLLVIAIIIRIPNLDAIPQGDETYFPELVRYQLENGFSFTMETMTGIAYWGDLPLTGLIYIIYTFLFGYSIVKLRFLAMLIGLINLSLIFILTKKIFGIRSGLFALFLMVFSYWHIFASFSIERDGSFIMLIYILIFYIYIRYKENNNKINLVLISILILILLFFKSSGILIVGMLSLLFLKNSRIIQFIHIKNVSLQIKKLLFSQQLHKLLLEFVYLIIPVCGYLLFLLFMHTWNFEMFTGMYSHAAPLDILSFNLFSIMRVFIYLILWGSPFIFGLTLLSLKEYDIKKFPFLIWLLIPVIAYSFSEYAGSIDRYLSITIPPMCILGGIFLSKIKQIRPVLLMLFTLIGFTIFQLISLVKVEYIIHNINQYLFQFLTGNWKFIFPFYGAGQPTFMVSFIIIGSTLVVSTLFFILYLLQIKKDIMLLLFLAITFSFSLVIIEECNFHPFFPDFTIVTHEVNQYFNEHNLPLPVITPNKWLRLKLDLDYSQIILLNKNYFDEKERERINREGGTLILIHYPNYSYDAIINNLKQCKLQKEMAYNNNIKLSSIYICPPSLKSN